MLGLNLCLGLLEVMSSEESKTLMPSILLLLWAKREKLNISSSFYNLFNTSFSYPK